MKESRPTSPSIGIVAVNYNSKGFVGDFLDSLDSLDYADTKLIVVDSASTDGSLDEIIRRRPDAEIIRCDENVGTARGNNIGFQRCRELGVDYALVLNNDTTHEPDFLRRLMEAADGAPGRAGRTMLVPRILYADDHALISTHAGDFDWTLGLFRNTYHAKPDSEATRQRRQLQTASFCCFLAPMSVFNEVGPLDERFFMYYEETDFIRKALDLGYVLLYVPEAVIYHEESGSSGGGWMNPFKQYYASRNRLYLVRKHASSRIRYALFTLYFWAGRLAKLPCYIVPRQRALIRAQLRGMADYYQGHMGRTLEVEDF